MGMLFGLAPWIVYWVLVGNVPFAAAVLVALAIAAASLGVGGAVGRKWQSFDFASVAVLLILAVLAFTLSESFLERWILPLSNAGIFLVTLIGVLVGKPFVAEFAAAEQAPDVIKTELFGRIVKILSWLWVATFAGMTVSSVIPSILEGATGGPSGTTAALMLDTKTPLSFLCYWIIPFRAVGRSRRWRRDCCRTGCSPGSTTSRGKPRSSPTTKPPSTSSTSWPRNTPIVRSARARRPMPSRSAGWEPR